MSPTNWGHFQDRNGNCNVVFKGEGVGGGGVGRSTRRQTRGVEKKRKKLNVHMESTPRLESRAHWREASVQHFAVYTTLLYQ